MEEPEHKHLPHLRSFVRQPVVFITAVTHERQPLLACAAAHETLRTIWHQSLEKDGWAVGRYVLMPDHVHLFAQPTMEGKSVAQWIQGWKSISSRHLAKALGVPTPIWQKDYFDRYLRSSDNYRQKWEYMLANPVRKGLVSSPDAWPFQGVIVDLRF